MKNVQYRIYIFVSIIISILIFQSCTSHSELYTLAGKESLTQRDSLVLFASVGISSAPFYIVVNILNDSRKIPTCIRANLLYNATRLKLGYNRDIAYSEPVMESVIRYIY